MKDADNAHDIPSAEDEEIDEVPPAAIGAAGEWIGTPEACARLGVTLRTLYRFIDSGQLPAYKMGRVIRLRAHEVEEFIQSARIAPGTLEHLYPEPHPRSERPKGSSSRAARPVSSRARSLRARQGEEGEEPQAGDAGRPGS